MAPRKLTYDQLEGICLMLKTFTAGIQEALQTSMENALTIALQNQCNRCGVES